MDEKTKLFKLNQQILENELKKYQEAVEKYKSYMDCMDDVSSWLKDLDK